MNSFQKKTLLHTLVCLLSLPLNLSADCHYEIYPEDVSMKRGFDSHLSGGYNEVLVKLSSDDQNANSRFDVANPNSIYAERDIRRPEFLDELILNEAEKNFSIEIVELDKFFIEHNDLLMSKVNFPVTQFRKKLKDGKTLLGPRNFIYQETDEGLSIFKATTTIENNLVSVLLAIKKYCEI